ncbi:hypothetical protein EDB19DRAFT_1832949 [Suillus lakei]|nr:hypothetical protein EDB19DRAFT_1832949 [Suillus lakei]
MRFATLIALAVAASTAPSFAAPAPYSSRRVAAKRDTTSADDNTIVDTSVRNGFVPPRIGTVILPGSNLSPTSKRDTTSDLVQAIEAALDELSSARKRDITADITAALQSLLQESGSVLSNVKRDSASSDVEDRSVKLPEVPSSVSTALEDAGNLASIGGGLAKIWDSLEGSPSSNNTKRQVDSILPVEERALKIPKISTSASSLFNDIGNVISLGVGADAIASAFSGSNSTRRDLDQTSDGVDVAGDFGGEALQFEDRSVNIPSSVSSILGKIAGVVSVGGTAASLLSAFDGSGNSTKRELGMDLGHVHDEKRAVSSDIESILQQIIASLEGASTSTKRSTSDDGFLGLTHTITPEQLDELS